MATDNAASPETSPLAGLVESRRRRAVLALGVLLALCLALFVVALGSGALAIPPATVVAELQRALFGPASVENSRDALVILSIRLPRALLALEIGAALAVSGALMQGLFRNPLADPGLIGVSGGAALAAAVTIVLGDSLFGGLRGGLRFAVLPIGAFTGGLAATLVLYAIATRDGRTSMATMLLAGVALGAFTGALTGLLAFLSNDQQLRDLTFWTLGSLNGASWARVAAVTPIILPVLFAAPFLGRGMNALAIGEAEAFHLGFRVQLIKSATIILVALAVGAAVASSGIIGFVGIVSPHVVRLAVGPDNRLLLPLAMTLGAALLVAADTLARVIVAPAELPVGVLTSAIGAPFFLWLLLRQGRGVEI